MVLIFENLDWWLIGNLLAHFLWLIIWHIQHGSGFLHLVQFLKRFKKLNPLDLLGGFKFKHLSGPSLLGK